MLLVLKSLKNVKNINDFYKSTFLKDYPKYVLFLVDFLYRHTQTVLLNSYQVLEKFTDSVITEFWAVHPQRQGTLCQEHSLCVLYIPFSFLV